MASKVQIASFSDIAQLAAAQGASDLVLNVLKFEALETAEKRIRMLQTSEALTQDFVLYLLFHQTDFFTAYIHPLLEDRSQGVFDLFCFYFAAAKPDAETLRKLAPRVDQLFCLYATNAQEFNGCEIAMLLVMRSFYANIEPSLRVLSANEIQDRTMQLNRKLSRIAELEAPKAACNGMGMPPKVEDRVIQETDNLYCEATWQNASYGYNDVKFTSFWLNFVRRLVFGDQMQIQPLLEAILLDSQSACNLALACAQVDHELSYTVKADETQRASFSIQSSLKLSHPQRNRIIQLSGVAEVQAEGFFEGLVVYKLCDGLLSEDLQQTIENEVQLVPGVNKLDLCQHLCCFQEDVQSISVVLYINNQEFPLHVEVEPQPIDQLVRIATCDAQLRYARLASTEQQIAQINQFLNAQQYQQLLHNAELAYELLTVYMEVERKNREVYERLELLVGLIHHNEDIVQKYVQREYHGIIDASVRDFAPDSQYTFAVRSNVQLLAQDNDSLPNLLPKSLSSVDTLCYLRLVLKQHVFRLDDAEIGQLAQLYFKQARYQELTALAVTESNCNAHIFWLLSRIAQGENALDELRAFRDQNLACLNQRNARIISELLGEQEEQPFIVSEENGRLSFSKTPVHIKLWRKTLFHEASGVPTIRPHIELDVGEEHYVLQERGNFVVLCQHELEECLLEVNHTNIQWTVDSTEGILTLQGADISHKYYCWATLQGQFYKDGFTDAQGRFDYFTVSDREGASSELNITIIGPQGDFVQFLAPPVGQVVREDARHVAPVPQPRRPGRFPILPM